VFKELDVNFLQGGVLLNMNHKKRVAVIFGGQSTEHEVSRFSAQSVIENLDKSKYDIVMIGITKEGKWLTYSGPAEKIGTGEWQAIAESQRLRPEKIELGSVSGSVSGGTVDYSNSARNILIASGAENDIKKVDVVFPVLHGLNGEDGTIQGLFELAGMPYVGCEVLGSALCMDKAFAKIVFDKEGIPQGKYIAFNKRQFQIDTDKIISEVENILEYPCFVKPCNSGSSVGVSKVRNRRELIDAISLAGMYDRRILVEEYINGREIECSVLGNDNPVASTVGEVIPDKEFYDYEAKYSSESTSEIIIPARLPESSIEKIREYAVKAFKALDCAGLARVDFFVHKETGEIYINEINTMPGFTKISMYPKLWEASGLPYGELLNKLIELSIERYNEKTE